MFKQPKKRPCKVCGKDAYRPECDVCRAKRYKKKSMERNKEKVTRTGELELFKQLCKTRRPFVSLVTGKPLAKYIGTDLFVNCFAHVLNKGMYPKYRLNPENIQYLTPREHLLVDQGTEDNRKKYVQECLINGIHCDWSRWYELKEKLRKQILTDDREFFFKLSSNNEEE